MASYFLDAQGNKTTDPNKAATLVVDNPGDNDSQTTLPSDGLFIDPTDGAVWLRQNGKLYEVSADNVKQAGIDTNTLPKFEFAQIISPELGFVKGGVETDIPTLKSAAASTSTEQRTTTTSGAIENTPEAIGALQGQTPEQITAEQARIKSEPGYGGGTSSGTVQTAGAQTSTGYVYGDDVLDKKANNSAVNHLYQQYFGRDATQAELDNWGEKGGTDTTVRALEDFLKKEKGAGGTSNQGGTVTVEKNGHQMTVSRENVGIWTGAGWTEVAGSGTTDGTIDGTTDGTGTDTTEPPFDAESLNKFLSALPPDQAALIKGIVDKFNFGDDIDNEEILKKFNQLSQEVIDPYFSELINTYKKDVEIAVARQNEDFTKLEQLQKEQAAATIRQTQGNLEASGLSRTGEAVYQLGDTSAYSGTGVQGEIPKAIMRISESSRSDYLRNLQDMGRTAEKQLGSGNLGSLVPNYTQQGGITGAIPQQKEGTQAALLGGLAGQQDLLTTYRSLYL